MSYDRKPVVFTAEQKEAMRRRAETARRRRKEEGLRRERSKANFMSQKQAKKEYDKMLELAHSQHGVLFDEEANKLQALAERLDIVLPWRHIVLDVPAKTGKGRYNGR